MAKLLVVDNDSKMLAHYAKELGNDGYDVMTILNARRALEYFQFNRPDLVVLDIHLPGMDGLEAMGHILSIDHSVPVIFVSACPLERDNYLSWSANAYIEKSSDLTELKQTIKEVLTSRAKSVPA